MNRKEKESTCKSKECIVNSFCSSYSISGEQGNSMLVSVQGQFSWRGEAGATLSVGFERGEAGRRRYKWLVSVGMDVVQVNEFFRESFSQTKKEVLHLTEELSGMTVLSQSEVLLFVGNLSVWVKSRKGIMLLPFTGNGFYRHLIGWLV